VSRRAEAIAATLSGAGFDSRLSTTILQEMWEKWVLIATMGASNCLLRAAVGDIVAAGAENVSLGLLGECAGIATARGYAPSDAAMTRNRAMLTAKGSAFTASMLRDIENGAPIEAAHIVGDLIRRGGGGPSDFPLLRIAYAHLRAYEARREREHRGGAKAA
jgi:2-dehydropantoate 2-reductase